MTAITHAAILKAGRYQGVRIDAGEAGTARSLHRSTIHGVLRMDAYAFGN